MRPIGVNLIIHLINKQYQVKGESMKKLTIGVLLVVLLSSGCAYHKQTLLTVKGDDVSVPLGPLEGIKGKGIKAVLYRAVSIAFPAKDAIKELKNVKATDETGADGGTGSVDITQ